MYMKVTFDKRQLCREKLQFNLQIKFCLEKKNHSLYKSDFVLQTPPVSTKQLSTKTKFHFVYDIDLNQTLFNCVYTNDFCQVRFNFVYKITSVQQFCSSNTPHTATKSQEGHLLLWRWTRQFCSSNTPHTATQNCHKQTGRSFVIVEMDKTVLLL